MMPWGPWRPDVGGPNSGMAAIANSVLPQASADGIGYGPLPSLVEPGGAVALAGTPLGGIALQKQDSSWQVYFASSTKIQRLTSTYGWSDIETGRTVTPGDDVSFCYYGKYLLNSDTTDGFKAYDVEAGGSNSTVSAAPAARYIFSCNNVVFALSCGGNTKRMQSSAIGNHADWTGIGADGKTFEDGGPLVCGCDLKNGAGLIFQEYAMRLIQFGQGAGPYSVVKVSDGRGIVSSRSMVSFDGMAFYLATDGFYKFSLAEGNKPIGAEKVNRWLSRQLTTSEYESVQGAVDPFNKVVWWRLNSTTLLGYDWQLDEFFTATAETSALTRIATASIVIDDVTDTIDSVTTTIDSRLWQGGQPFFGTLGTTYKFAAFSGGAMEATLRSCIMSGPNSRRFTWATPISDAEDSTLAIGVSDSLAAALNWEDGQTRNEDGEVPLDARGRRFAFEEVIPADEDWTYSNGVDQIVANEDGPRQ